MFTYKEKYRPEETPYAKRVVEVYENGDFIGQIEERESYCCFMYWDGDRLSYGTRCTSIADGKRKLQSSRYQPRRSHRPENCNVACLPSGNADDFYPTPSALAGRMFARVDWSKVESILEPSAGKAEFTYFTATFYKKGTCHIKFKPEAAVLIDRLNIFAARQHSWLPPDYGRKSYDAMTAEEQQVIDSFQGREAYEKVAADPASFLLDGRSMMALPAGA